MPVTSIVLKSLEARRYQDLQPNQQVRIDHNSTITLVAKEAADRMRVEFGYTTSYGALGVVKIEGVTPGLTHQGIAATFCQLWRHGAYFSHGDGGFAVECFAD